MSNWSESANEKLFSLLLKVIKFVTLIFLLSHLSGCIWGFIALQQKDGNGNFDPNSWPYKYGIYNCKLDFHHTIATKYAPSSPAFEGPSLSIVYLPVVSQLNLVSVGSLFGLIFSIYLFFFLRFCFVVAVCVFFFFLREH